MSVGRKKHQSSARHPLSNRPRRVHSLTQPARQFGISTGSTFAEQRWVSWPLERSFGAANLPEIVMAFAAKPFRSRLFIELKADFSRATTYPTANVWPTPHMLNADGSQMSSTEDPENASIFKHLKRITIKLNEVLHLLLESKQQFRTAGLLPP